MLKLIYRWNLIFQYAGIGEEQTAFWGEINERKSQAKKEGGKKRSSDMTICFLKYLNLLPFCVFILVPFLKDKIVLFRLLVCLTHRKFEDCYFDQSSSPLLSDINKLLFQGHGFCSGVSQPQHRWHFGPG